MFSTKRHNLGSGRNELSRADLPLADCAVGRRNNSCVTQIYLRDSQRGFFGVEISREQCPLRFEYSFASPLSFSCRFITAEQSAGLRQVRITACKLGNEPFVIGDCCFDLLLGCGICFEQRFLPNPLQTCARHICLHASFPAWAAVIWA
jgi:hypothetical protein